MNAGIVLENSNNSFGQASESSSEPIHNMDLTIPFIIQLRNPNTAG